MNSTNTTDTGIVSINAEITKAKNIVDRFESENYSYMINAATPAKFVKAVNSVQLAAFFAEAFAIGMASGQILPAIDPALNAEIVAQYQAEVAAYNAACHYTQVEMLAKFSAGELSQVQFLEYMADNAKHSLKPEGERPAQPVKQLGEGEASTLKDIRKNKNKFPVYILKGDVKRFTDALCDYVNAKIELQSAENERVQAEKEAADAAKEATLTA